ncbi:MAG TPA: L-threonylcarbamoyladenylate synthase [Gammaproteobacteria bacterium]|nr:L-threonylcarbamoyladenylate synthase [Gammaproteobacteria bacterium]
MQKNDITKAVLLLRAGGLVALPTETVYGLGADASNPEAVRKIFLAKQRPSDHPIIVHIAHVSQMTDWARDIPEQALLLARAFWPGPLTLILKKAPEVSSILTGNQETIGLRIPNHPVALAVLKEFGGGIAAPSANRFGRISPTTAAAVREELGGAVDLVLEGGQCEVGVESTIVDLSGECPAVLRPGMITADQIEAVLEQPLLRKKKNAPRVPGALESHYAPVTPVHLIPAVQLKVFLQSRTEVETFAIIALSEFNAEGMNVIKMPRNPQWYAHDLYYVMRELDKKGLKEIIVESVPDGVEWDAVRDRLLRAAT